MFVFGSDTASSLRCVLRITFMTQRELERWDELREERMTCWGQCDGPKWLPYGWLLYLMVRVTRFESLVLECCRTVGDCRFTYKAVSHW
jgi:hypothetical protein